MAVKNQINAPAVDHLMNEGTLIPELCFGTEKVYQLEDERWFIAEDGTVYPMVSEDTSVVEEFAE